MTDVSAVVYRKLQKFIDAEMMKRLEENKEFNEQPKTTNCLGEVTVSLR